jgi:hypothetical protein
MRRLSLMRLFGKPKEKAKLSVACPAKTNWLGVPAGLL